MSLPDARVVFFGSGEIAIPSFQRLLRSGPRPLALVTQPDKPAGRHRSALTPPPIKRIAVAAEVPVWQPESARDEAFLARLRELAPDLMVVMAYGQILPKALIGIPRLACVNLHASLLPRHRGASCIQAAIDAGDPVTGVTVMHVAPKLDAGDIIHAESVAIHAGATGGQVHDLLGEVAADALSAVLPALLDGSAPRRPQDESLATYAPKLEREDGRIDWQGDAVAIARRIRAYDPWPGTWCLAQDAAGAKRLKIFAAAAEPGDGGEPGTMSSDGGAAPCVSCGSGRLRLLEVQAEGGRRMPAAEWVKGLRVLPRLR